ncbi:MAG: helix-turn-helix domain-containing protein [Bacteriovoracia bacterium]
MTKQYLISRKYEEVGVYLQAARAAKNLTQGRVARLLGYSSAQFISNFERGIALPPVKKLKVLIRLYDIPASELIDIINATEREILASALGEKNGPQKVRRAE